MNSSAMPPSLLSRASAAAQRGLSPEIVLQERDIRFEDYLNDKIQATADFGSLASLIANVETQKKQLEEQVRDSSRYLKAPNTKFL